MKLGQKSKLTIADASNFALMSLFLCILVKCMLIILPKPVLRPVPLTFMVTCSEGTEFVWMYALVLTKRTLNYNSAII